MSLDLFFFFLYFPFYFPKLRQFTYAFLSLPCFYQPILCISIIYGEMYALHKIWEHSTQPSVFANQYYGLVVTSDRHTHQHKLNSAEVSRILCIMD